MTTLSQNKLRFAPSPTGYLHIGNARTLILNYIFAKSLQGDLILRIDDTDKERSEEKFYDSIIEDMTWLNIDILDIKRQSEKTDQYKKIRDILIDKGKLYPCFETDEELNKIRKLNLSRGLPPIYNRASLSLSSKEIEELKSLGRKPYWRYRLNHEDVSWSDLIRGNQTIDCSTFSDPVLIRADGSFLYTLPSVIDDIDMKITHVLRGEDHVSNTATQIQLFDELNAEIPSFGHHSLMVHKDGSRMSKRTGSMSLRDIRDAGIEAITLVNYCARIGTSDAVEAYQDTSDLIKNYDLSKISRSPARYSYEEIELLNKKILQNKTFASVKTDLSKLGINDEIAEKFWNIIRSNINSISESQKWWDIINKDIRCDLELEDSNFFSIAYDSLPQEPWDDTTWLSWTGEVSKKTSRKGRELYLPLRLAITGENSGPELASFLLLLGRGKVTERLEFHIK
jgi:glutamyl-tRNA synthetase